MKKNDIISVDIVDISHDGSGIGKTADGFVVFVPGALKGEKINVLILKVLKNFAYGKISEFISISPCRTEEVCPVFSKCGGCVYMHTTYKNELDIKKQRVKNALLSVAKTDFPVSDTLGGEEWHYRNKMLVPLFWDKDNKVKAGFFRKNSHDVIPMEKCYISNEEFLTITNAITDFCNKYNVMPYNEKTKKGIIRHIYIRRGFHTGEIMAGVVTKTKKLPYKDEFISCLTSLNLNIVSIIQNINEKDTNVILGNKTETLFGKSYITDYMLGNKFNISCEAFYQVNTPMAEKLYETAISYLDENDKTVFDLYCGAGTITLSIAKKAHKVIGIESCEPAVQNAKDNARENNMQNAEFICGEAETKIFELIEKGITPDAVMLDPPRSGCDIKLLKALLDLKPKKIIYISCNPSTMARDIKELSEAYTLKSVQPVDLFPKTSHIECCVQLCRTHAI